ncbi:unnamed protein product, partial [Medioppia subpectinata]
MNSMNGEKNGGQNGPKIVEMVYSLLEMLRLSSAQEMSSKLLLMSHSPQICQEMRQHGCLPLLIQLIHQPIDADNSAANGEDASQRLADERQLRDRASKTLKNIIYNSAKSRREIRVLKLIDDLRSFVNYLRLNGQQTANEELTDHPNGSVAYLLKVSFDEQHRHIITLLGGVYAIAEVIQYDYEYHKNARNNGCIALRRYSLMTLINLTFGDSQTKSLLATMKSFMRALVHNLESPAEELRQVAASLLRNLSWKADYITKQILREVGTVALLTQAGLEATKESTLKSILSALWNLTAHCGPNKADFCGVKGALPFLISTLTPNSSTNSMTIVENGGGILRNISSYIVMNEEYRQVLRKHNTLAILLEQLKSPSIPVVSNACVTLWNLSAHCPKDQSTLWELGAVPMLRNLTTSRHKMIAMGSSATLKNLFSSSVAPNYRSMNGNDSYGCVNGSNSCSIPSLEARKLKALKDDMNCNLSETYDPIDSPKVSPSHEPYVRCKSTTTLKNVYLPGRMYTSLSGHINPHQVSRSSSHDSIGSTHSEPVTKFKDMEHNMRSIYPFSTQLMPQMYSTLSSNDSRISDKDLDIGADFDVYCGESNSQMNISAKSSSFTDAELDVDLDCDPEPTDYSKRYKERAIDDFIAPRCIRPRVRQLDVDLDCDPEPTDYSKRYKERAIDDFIAPRCNTSHKPEVAACEDSVKVYKTEGTPLNFSLASSLSDLRDTGLTFAEEKKDLCASLAANDAHNSTTFDAIAQHYKHCNNSDIKTSDKPRVMFKKPTLPPKPKFTISPKKPTIDESVEECDHSHKIEPNNSANNSVVFDDNLMKASISTNSIVSNENICEETPLMYSRSSSINSLSDCEIKSDVCQSSVVSEFSRRASEVVTPSDLPDSPLDSPRPLSPKPTPRLHDRQTGKRETDRQTTAVHNKCNSNEMDCKPTDNVSENCVFFEDRHITYATEGTPAIFSLCTSLSSLTEDIDAINLNDNNGYKSDGLTQIVEVNDMNDMDSQIVYTSSEDEGEDQLLAACISSGMKSISNEKTISCNSLQRIKPKEVVVNSSSVKSIPIPKQRSTASSESMTRSAPDGRPSYMNAMKVSPISPILPILPILTTHAYNDRKDTIQVYATEDTPCVLSKTSSLTNGKSRNTSMNPIHNISDESDDEEILQKCIESGMTASRKLINTSNKCDKNANKRSPKTPKSTPNASPNSENLNAMTHKKDDKSDINADQSRRYFVEDTPVQLSHCQSSLSSLSIDSDDHMEDQKLLNEAITRGMNQKKTSTKTTKSKSHHKKATDNVMTSSNRSVESVDDAITYTVYYKSDGLAKGELNRKPNDSVMVSSVMTDSSCLSDLDHQKPPSLMDNSMFSSTESFSYRQMAPKPTQTKPANKRSDESQILLENVKPPSLMDEISMSQSCASITSDIPDLAFDNEAKNDSKISEMAKMCANRINSMTYSADNLHVDPNETTFHNKNALNSKIISTQFEYDLSDTEISEDIPVDNAGPKCVSQNDIIMDFTTSSSTLLSLESPTICSDVISEFEDKTRLSRREKELMLSKRRFSPIGSEECLATDEHSVVSDGSDADSATYNVNSPRRARIVRPVASKSSNDKFESVIPFNYSLAKNKYTAKQTRTSALRASRSRSVETHLSEDTIISHNKVTDRHMYSNDGNKYIDYMVHKADFAFTDYKRAKPRADTSAKNREHNNKSLLTSVRSKLSASLSSHALGASNASLSSNSSNGLTPSCASFSRRLEVQSRIASLWKRSKSTATESKSKKMDLSRSISARRSFGKSKKNVDQKGGSLVRSSTYEKLPQSPDEASNTFFATKHDHNCNDDNNSQEFGQFSADVSRHSCLSHRCLSHHILAPNITYKILNKQNESIVDDIQLEFPETDALDLLQVLEAMGLCVQCDHEEDIAYEFPSLQHQSPKDCQNWVSDDNIGEHDVYDMHNMVYCG